jgi:formylglycine-generating enzyme required for sulfatase activity
MADIFISYSRKDQAYVRELTSFLENEGLSVWVDDRINHGDRWWRTIVANIRECAAMVVVMTPESEKTDWVEKEYLFAKKENKPLFPLLLEGDCFPFFVNQQYHDVRDGRLPPKKFIERLLRCETVLKTYTNSIGMEFVLIPAGSFMMGSKLSPDEIVQKYGREAKWWKDQHPQHKVTISNPFYLHSTQVTQGLWQEVMGGNPSKFKDCGDDCPVENVSWYDAQEFISKLNDKEGTDKYRLPTEAEWEYACRAGTTSEFSFGDDPTKLAEYAWYFDNSDKKTHPVRQKKTNPWGLYDMHGNVWEWCQDWHGDYSSNPVVDPQGPDKGGGRVLRGGSWFVSAGFIRSACRDWDYPVNPFYSYGFRIARGF